MTHIIVALVLLQLFVAYGQECAVDSSLPLFNPSVYHYTSIDSIIATNIGDVTPPVVTPPNAGIYLLPNSALGYLGPIGTYGPLSSLGPLGSNTWNPSTWVSGTGWDWTTYSQQISGLGGPLSAAGPLGSNGPLSEDAYYTDMPCINDFSEQLSAGGLWTVLGPLGPLGPSGALGPLGPIGAHGYATDANGQYKFANGTIVRSITAPWDSTSSRKWDLFESYTQSFASQFTDNDCSFVVQGVVNSLGASAHKYTFTSKVAQYVTIVVVPLKQYDTWRLTLKNTWGATIATVGPSVYVNWIQIRVPANTKMTAEITLSSSFHFLPKDYRLYVAGSSPHIAPGTHIQGPHLISYTPV